jgi:type IV fimbrial biogenesis protein FimT
MRAPGFVGPSAGFTLIELLVTLVLLGVLAGLAAPSFTDTIRRNRLATQTNELAAALALARTEAIRRNGRAGVCPSDEDQTACSTDSDDWVNGWLVWSGTEDNIVSVYRLGSDVITSAHDELVFGDRGQRVAPAAADVFLLNTYGCATGEPKARRISVLGSGQVTIAESNCL